MAKKTKSDEPAKQSYVTVKMLEDSRSDLLQKSIMLINRIQVLEDKVKVLDALHTQRIGASINKVETFNDVQNTTVHPPTRGGMRYEQQIASVRNACAVLPPNLIFNGRHTSENVSALCGFVVTHDMLDEIYGD